MMEWRAFESLFGPITVQERVDAAGAIAAYGAAASAGAKVEPSDLMPNWSGKSKQEQTQTPEEMMAIVGTFREPKGSNDDDA